MKPKKYISELEKIQVPYNQAIAMLSEKFRREYIIPACIKFDLTFTNRANSNGFGYIGFTWEGDCPINTVFDIEKLTRKDPMYYMEVLSKKIAKEMRKDLKPIFQAIKAGMRPESVSWGDIRNLI